jgi:hypothetical protein
MLGYEGYISLCGINVLGTGSTVPRALLRIDSTSGYGGKITGAVDTGIGFPHAYDWEQHDGSLNFEVTSGLFGALKTWILSRQSSRAVSLLSRNANLQSYSAVYWNTVSISAADGAAVEGSVGFIAIVRNSYSYGTTGVAGYTGNDVGQGVVSGMAPLNPAAGNISPVPFWNTEISLGGALDFITWSLDLSQEVVKFFGCSGSNATAQEPLYLAVGPMTATFSGTYIFTAPTADSVNGTLDVAGTTITMNRMELQSISDDVLTGDSLVPLNVEYAIYELS